MESFGLLNTGLPLAALTALALVLPLVTVPRATRSQRRLALGIGLAAALTLVAGAGLFALLYGAGDGTPRLAAVLRGSGLAALVWAPLLVLSWFVRAQAVERRRGEDIARRVDGDGPRGENER
ncbi:hypothetical protein [Maritimibacter sp. HL-12]|uniref:hypothetical protein n=1 Tax=Maritimibacter sp. HL-12 TaxID=1162418 RepID=UPI000A0EF04A|nr:hypothetical protein [Maritimibacter sp. HL-12]SMH49558.1 hypothetical protein SAMN05661107_2169 [Maritimibacter sp. HL-12]